MPLTKTPGVLDATHGVGCFASRVDVPANRNQPARVVQSIAPLPAIEVFIPATDVSHAGLPTAPA
jgi:hypothetical protein